VRYIVPFPPGGGADTVARLLVPVLNEVPGAPYLVIDNRGGAGGNIGMEALARSAPDGATLGQVSIATHGTNPTLFARQGFDPVADFTPVALIGQQPVTISVPAEGPIRTLADLRAQTGEIDGGSPGNGTSGHLTTEVLKARTGLKITHVPYRGSGPLWADLVGRRIGVAADNIHVALPHHQAGRTRIIAITGRARSPLLPDVPALAESLPDSVVYSWNGIAGPAGLPAPLVAQLAGALRTAFASPGLRARYAELGLEITEPDPEAFAAFIRHEIGFWRRIITAANIRLE
jgi:tripartite-type tricarboxylate transporter receptor subunit TctC